MSEQHSTMAAEVGKAPPVAIHALVHMITETNALWLKTLYKKEVLSKEDVDTFIESIEHLSELGNESPKDYEKLKAEMLKHMADVLTQIYKSS